MSNIFILVGDPSLGPTKLYINFLFPLIQTVLFKNNELIMNLFRAVVLLSPKVVFY